MHTHTQHVQCVTEKLPHPLLIASDNQIDYTSTRADRGSIMGPPERKLLM